MKKNFPSFILPQSFFVFNFFIHLFFLFFCLVEFYLFNFFFHLLTYIYRRGTFYFLQPRTPVSLPNGFIYIHPFIYTTYINTYIVAVNYKNFFLLPTKPNKRICDNGSLYITMLYACIYAAA